MTHRCDICGGRMPYQHIGRPRARHRGGACEREYRRRRQAGWVKVAAPARSVVYLERVVPGDIPSAQIEARFAAALIEVKRRRYTVDPWEQRRTR